MVLQSLFERILGKKEIFLYVLLSLKIIKNISYSICGRVLLNTKNRLQNQRPFVFCFICLNRVENQFYLYFRFFHFHVPIPGKVKKLS